MKNFTYKKTETTSMKVIGILDTDRMIIDVDGEETGLATLLSDFNGGEIEINIKTKCEEDVEEPADVEKDE